ncbi:hypothetical protein Tco_0584789, partial [Tanacetum coccineum]
LDKFEGVDFRRWQKKRHFLLSSMSVVYVLATPISEDVAGLLVVKRQQCCWSFSCQYGGA